MKLIPIGYEIPTHDRRCHAHTSPQKKGVRKVPKTQHSCVQAPIYPDYPSSIYTFSLDHIHVKSGSNTKARRGFSRPANVYHQRQDSRTVPLRHPPHVSRAHNSNLSLVLCAICHGACTGHPWMLPLRHESFQEGDL